MGSIPVVCTKRLTKVNLKSSLTKMVREEKKRVKQERFRGKID